LKIDIFVLVTNH